MLQRNNQKKECDWLHFSRIRTTAWRCSFNFREAAKVTVKIMKLHVDKIEPTEYQRLLMTRKTSFSYKLLSIKAISHKWNYFHHLCGKKNRCFDHLKLNKAPSIHTTRKKFEDTALNLWLGLRSTLIRCKKRSFCKLFKPEEFENAGFSFSLWT